MCRVRDQGPSCEFPNSPAWEIGSVDRRVFGSPPVNVGHRRWNSGQTFDNVTSPGGAGLWATAKTSFRITREFARGTQLRNVMVYPGAYRRHALTVEDDECQTTQHNRLPTQRWQTKRSSWSSSPPSPVRQWDGGLVGRTSRSLFQRSMGSNRRICCLFCRHRRLLQWFTSG